MKEIDDGIEFLEAQEKGVFRDILEEMIREHKSSRLAEDQTLQKYSGAANKQRDRTVVSKHLVDITPWMDQ